MRQKSQTRQTGDVVIAPLRRRFVEGKRRQAGKINAFYRLGDVVLDDPPQPLVGDVHEPGRSKHRHHPDQDHRCLFEQ